MEADLSALGGNVVIRSCRGNGQPSIHEDGHMGVEMLTGQGAVWSADLAAGHLETLKRLTERCGMSSGGSHSDIPLGKGIHLRGCHLVDDMSVDVQNCGS